MAVKGETDPIFLAIRDMCSEIDDPLPLRRAAVDLFMFTARNFEGHHTGKTIAAAYLHLAALQIGRFDINPNSLAIQFDLRSAQIRKKQRLIEEDRDMQKHGFNAGERIKLTLERLGISPEKRDTVLTDTMMIFTEIGNLFGSISPIIKAASAVYLACARNIEPRPQRRVMDAIDLPHSRAAVIRTISRYRHHHFMSRRCRGED